MIPVTCPCGTGMSYDGCCGPLHDGARSAVTAEELMRSRYTAYAVGHANYLFRTWHPRARPAEVGPPRDLSWTGLTIVDVEAGGPEDAEGMVEFEAAYDGPAGRAVLHERSCFVRRAGRWVYLEGEQRE